MKKTSLFIVKLIISTILVILLVRFVNWGNVLEHVQDVDVRYLGAFFVFLIGGLLISAVKWHFLARTQGFDEGVWFYLKTYIIGSFINNFLPSFVGGDAYRMYRLGQGKKHLRRASQTVIVDRMSGLIGVMVLAAFVGLFFALENPEQHVINVIVIGMIVALCVVAIVLFFYEKAFIQKMMGYLPQKIGRYITSLVGYRRTHISIPTFLYSVAFAFIGLAAANYMLFLAIGVSINPMEYLSVIFVISIIASAPISIGNIGVKEWAYVTLFGLLGVSASAAVTVVLMSRVLQMLMSLTALPLYLSDKNAESLSGK